MKRQEGPNKKSVNIYSHDYGSCYGYKIVSAVYILIHEDMQKN